MKFKINYTLLFFFAASIMFAGEWSQTFLPLRQTGVEEFLKKYPEYDGRGTIILILDTGVDQGIEGLTRTSTGEVKVIDVQDFTGQGDIQLFKAEKDEDDDQFYFVNEDNGLKVAGADKLGLKSINDEYLIGVIEEKLWTNSSSGAADVNGNGTKTDKFHIVVFETESDGEKYWVAYFDKNGDGDLSEENPIRNYKEKFDSFTIPNEDGLCNFTIGLNIFPDKKKVNFHFDDGAHGTHCAGIAAGNNIGETVLNGVAPGAYLMSLKLGNNNFSGGATVTESMKKAYLYADKISKERKEPCIINMSFGVGSEIEGQSDMEKFLDDLLKENPYLYVCTSNGNEGPGISTAGLPSSSRKVFSSGAVLTKDIAAANYGAVIDEDIILYFSSRGGEVCKPDVVSPGASTSTVPNWESSDKYWGTSMASPYTAGVVSLLLSAIGNEYPDVKIPSGLLFKLIKESAVKLSGYNHLDQGGGYINVENAYEEIKKYIAGGEIKNYEEYSVTTLSPNMPYERGECLYLRNGKYLTGKETISFTINRDNFIDQKKFYRIYDLKSDSDWLIPIQNSVYIRNDQSASVQVKFDAEKMKEPGLYNGKIYATRSGSSKINEFNLMVTVVIPHEFSSENSFKKSFCGKLAPGKIERYFVNVPVGASAMRITLKSKEGKYTSSKFRVHDPDGKDFYVSPTLNSIENEESVSKTFYNLLPGVYEVVATGFYKAKAVSNYDLKIEFEMVSPTQKNILSQRNSSVEIINNSNHVRQYSLSGFIDGYEKEYSIELNGVKDLPISIDNELEKKIFKFSLSKEDFNKITDFAFLLVDEDGKAVAKASLSYKDGELEFDNNRTNDSTNYTLKMLPGFAHSGSYLTLNVKEESVFKNKESFVVTSQNKSVVSIYPSITEKLECEFYQPRVKISSDEKYIGKIYLTPKSESEIKLEIPVHIKLSEEVI